MKLYSGPLSLFTAKVRIALREKGLSCDLWSVPFCRETGYDPKPDAVLRLHPKGQVPILIDGETVVYDSTQIFEYLEERNPTPRLYPEGLGERARCREIEAYADEVFFPKIWPLVEEVFYKADPSKRDDERVSAAHREIEKDFARLDRELAGREYFCGAFSVADIGVFMAVMFSINFGCAPGEGHRTLSAWLERTSARPAVKAEVEGMTADAARIGAGEKLPEGPRSL